MMLLHRDAGPIEKPACATKNRGFCCSVISSYALQCTHAAAHAAANSPMALASAASAIKEMDKHFCLHNRQDATGPALVLD